MKRSLLGLVVVMALVLGITAVAVAATVDCTTGNVCNGTRNGDIMNGTPGADRVYGGFGQGGVDLVFGNGADDTIIVAQRGYPEEDGEVEVTREVVDCGTGEDTVYRDRGLDIIADNCEHKRKGYPAMGGASAQRGSSAQGGLIGASPSGE